MSFTLAKECGNCGGYEERTFRDSYTGKELCLMCLAPIAKQISMSPSTDGDNLKQLRAEQGDGYIKDDNDDIHADVLVAVSMSRFNDPNRQRKENSMSRHGWYFTIVSYSDTAIEHAVICIDDEFDGYIHRMRAAWTDLDTAFGEDGKPTVELVFPNVALVKTLNGVCAEDMDNCIDNASGFWARLPLQPIQELLHASGQLTRSEILDFLRETEVSGSKARLHMYKPGHVNVIVDPSDSTEFIRTEFINTTLLPVDNNPNND